MLQSFSNKKKKNQFICHFISVQHVLNVLIQGLQYNFFFENALSFDAEPYVQNLFSKYQSN